MTFVWPQCNCCFKVEQRLKCWSSFLEHETWDQGCRQPVRYALTVKALPKKGPVASNLPATFEDVLEVDLQSVCVAELPLPGQPVPRGSTDSRQGLSSSACSWASSSHPDLKF